MREESRTKTPIGGVEGGRFWARVRAQATLRLLEALNQVHSGRGRMRRLQRDARFGRLLAELVEAVVVWGLPLLHPPRIRIRRGENFGSATTSCVGTNKIIATWATAPTTLRPACSHHCHANVPNAPPRLFLSAIPTRYIHLLQHGSLPCVVVMWQRRLMC